MPIAIKAGKVKIDPPPASALNRPAASAAAKRIRKSRAKIILRYGPSPSSVPTQDERFKETASIPLILSAVELVETANRRITPPSASPGDPRSRPKLWRGRASSARHGPDRG